MEYKRRVSLTNKLGLHVRPATLLAQRANSFSSEVSLEMNGKRVNAKSCIEILTLAAPPGTDLYVIATGEDAKKAVEELSALFETNFGEEKILDANNKK